MVKSSSQFQTCSTKTIGGKCSRSLGLLILYSSLFLISLQSQAVGISNAEKIPDYILKELIDIAQQAGESRLAISSKSRTVEKQVEVMLDYYILCDKGRFASKKEKCGIGLAKQVYHADFHGGFDVFNANINRQRNVQLMTKALSESLTELGKKRTCMNHVVIPGVKTKYIAVDIKPSSVKNKKKFYQAVVANSNVKRFYYPPIKDVEPSQVKESAFHLEFLRQDSKVNESSSVQSNKEN